MQVDVWGYVVDGLFVTFLVSIIGGIAASSTAFNSLLVGMFGGTAHTQVLAVNSSISGGIGWIGNLTGAIGKGAEVTYRVTDATSQVFPLATYITIFALFIGAVLGIVVYAMSKISGARARPVAVPVQPV